MDFTFEHLSLTAMATGAAWGMTDTALCDELVSVWATEQRLAARRLEVIREIGVRDLARKQGATSLTAWLIGKLRLSGGQARRMVELAGLLESLCAQTAAELAAGRVNEGQAAIIGKAVADLADHGSVVQQKAEQTLLELAGGDLGMEPVALRRAAEHILEIVDPDKAEERQRKALEDAEKRAVRDRALSWSPFHDGTGRERLTGVFGAEDAATIKAALEALTQPAGPDDTRTAAQRRADALTDVCRYSLASGDLPDDGGDAAKVVVTINFDALAAGVGAGVLDNGVSLTPEAVRRLACHAGIVPAVLGSRSVPIDLGKARRLFTGAARRALVLRDRGCAFPGCDRPPKWTEGHHIVHWSRGGRTDLRNGVLLCGHHHRVIHQGEWKVRIAADGLPEFLPPAWLDPLQTPRRNRLHQTGPHTSGLLPAGLHQTNPHQRAPSNEPPPKGPAPNGPRATISGVSGHDNRR